MNDFDKLVCDALEDLMSLPKEIDTVYYADAIEAADKICKRQIAEMKQEHAFEVHDFVDRLNNEIHASVMDKQLKIDKLMLAIRNLIEESIEIW